MAESDKVFCPMAQIAKENEIITIKKAFMPYE
jgi:hypothetical protein